MAVTVSAREALPAWLQVLAIYAASLVLHVVLPGRSVRGYVCSNKGEPLVYKLNGIVVFVAICLLFQYGLTPPQQVVIYADYFNTCLTAFTLGILASLFFFLRPHADEPFSRCVTVDQLTRAGKVDKDKVTSARGVKTSAALAFFLGREWNPRLLGVDVKMWLYLVGATGLGCNILSCAAHQRAAWGGRTSMAMGTYLGCFAWFLVEYLLGEEVHLYTYDIFAEKIGFKLAWGCLVFYPCFYCIGAFSLAAARRGEDITGLQAAGCVALFLLGWVTTRGANMQKFYFRTRPDCKTFLFGLVKQEALPGTRILVSGWWGVARHLNYFGEILQALALALPGVAVGPTPLLRALPLLYPLYYVLLFVPRQIDDDALCLQKYGEQWSRYMKRVPYRIVPGVW